MKKIVLENLYDVCYKTKSGRLMVAKRISGITAEKAKAKLIREMRASSTFDKVVLVTKL